MTFAAIELIDDLLARERKARADAEVERRGRLRDLVQLERRIADLDATVMKLEATRADQVRAAVGESGVPLLTRKQIASLVGLSTDTVREKIREALKVDPLDVAYVGAKLEAAYRLDWLIRHFPSLPHLPSLECAPHHLGWGEKLDDGGWQTESDQ